VGTLVGSLFQGTYFAKVRASETKQMWLFWASIKSLEARVPVAVQIFSYNYGFFVYSSETVDPVGYGYR
jgi:hypothetical protein